MITVTWGIRRWLWCDSCGQVAVLHAGDVCVRCVARMDAEHPELWDLDAVARIFDVPLELLDPCNLAPAGWWCSRDGRHEGPCALRRRRSRLVRTLARWLIFRDR